MNDAQHWRYEPDRASVRATILFAAAVVGLLVISLITIAVLRSIFASERDAMHFADAEPPTPVGELQSLRQREQRNLDYYGWVDRDAGVVRIPINRAMQIRVSARAEQKAQTNP